LLLARQTADTESGSALLGDGPAAGASEQRADAHDHYRHWPAGMAAAKARMLVAPCCGLWPAGKGAAGRRSVSGKTSGSGCAGLSIERPPGFRAGTVWFRVQNRGRAIAGRYVRCLQGALVPVMTVTNGCGSVAVPTKVVLKGGGDRGNFTRRIGDSPLSPSDAAPGSALDCVNRGFQMIKIVTATAMLLASPIGAIAAPCQVNPAEVRVPASRVGEYCVIMQNGASVCGYADGVVCTHDALRQKGACQLSAGSPPQQLPNDYNPNAGR
jgi:hypothetical protein